MKTPTQRTLYYGSDTPLPETRSLRAGPLTVVYDNGDLRYIRLGEREVLRRVYAAVRDHNWGTVPARLSGVEIEEGRDQFRVAYVATHRQNDVDFVWRGTITGTTDGTITFRIAGEARSTFRRNRIGFCILHPMDLAGQPCTVTHVDGARTTSEFPEFVAPHQPFFDIRAITHAVQPGVRVEVLMEGDTFEMEDQRNWTDASYKTYCTPLGLPFPVEIQAGTRLVQQITIRLLDPVPAVVEDAQAARLTVTLRPDTTPLPRLGLEVASHGEPLTAAEITRLRALNLAHLRVVLRLYEPEVGAVLAQATQEAQALGIPLEVALWLSESAEQELADLRAHLERLNPPVCAWLVHQQGSVATSAELAELTRQHLGDYAPAALIGGGTDAFFAELNRNRPPLAALDLVTFSINPQVHAFANVDVVETLAAQGAAVSSARAFSADLPVAVSPVTFFMRWNPNATGSQPPTPPDQLPPRVDPRQMALFGAGWTVGSLKVLAEAGTASATYYETSGWLGVMERAAGSPLPELFASLPGGVFPLYHILAAAGEFAGGQVQASQSSAPLEVEALALVKAGRLRVLLANFTPEDQRVTLRGLSGPLRLKALDETTVLDAMRDPAGFRAAPGDALEGGPDGVVVELRPFAVVQVDTEPQA